MSEVKRTLGVKTGLRREQICYALFGKQKVNFKDLKRSSMFRKRQAKQPRLTDRGISDEQVIRLDTSAASDLADLITFIGPDED